MYKKTRIATAVSTVLLATASSGYAQTSAPKSPNLDAVTVTGIRASMEKSIVVKRNSDTMVEVISAEDVGKMPDKNLADSLQRLPGVAVRTDYDEAEKVSMRGTNPDMSLVLFNGHTISGGDWYVSDQGSSSRSTSLSLLPSSVLNQAQVYRTSKASIADGGLAGTINVTTRKPLEQKEKFGGSASIGMSYATLPDKAAPELNANLNWKNDEGTVGVIVQGFSEQRYARRDSASRFAYGTSSGWDVINTSTMRGITDASLAGTGLKASDLNGVRMPGSMSTEFVESKRERVGGLLSIQIKPSVNSDLTLTTFNSEMKANNFGRLTSSAIYSMLLGKNEPFGATGATAANTNATGIAGGPQVFAFIKNPVIIDTVSNYGFPLKVLKSAEIVFPAGTVPQYVGNSEGFYRDGAKATSGFLDIDGTFKISDSLTIKALLSTTKGVGTTELDQGATFARYGTGIVYGLNGTNTAPDSRYIGAGDNLPVRNADGSGYSLVGRAASGLRTTDSEVAQAFDAIYAQDSGFLSSLEVGVRQANHKRNLERFAPSANAAFTAATAPTTGSIPYPANFGNTLGGKFENTGFTYSPETLQAYIATQFRSVSPEFDRRVAGEIDLREIQTAAYVMQNIEAGNLSGNFGLRWVRTAVNANIVTPVPGGKCFHVEPGKTAPPCPAFPDAILTAGDGQPYFLNTPFVASSAGLFFKTPVERSFDHVLPSLNLRYELNKSMVARLGASKTIGRQNYNVLGQGFSNQTCAGAEGCVVTGPNPNLRPLTADNFDLAFSWYFAPRSVFSATVFKSSIDGYVKTGSLKQENSFVDLIDPVDNAVKPFFVKSAGQQGARIQGIDLSFERPIGWGFGMTSNISRATTDVDDGRPMVGASEWTGNLGGYFENDVFSARLVYNYRGKYVASSTAPSAIANSQGLSVINGISMPVALIWAAPVSNVALSMNYKYNKNVELSFNATNLTDPARGQYRYSEDEPQKVDVSGRQYYFNVSYKL